MFCAAFPGSWPFTHYGSARPLLLASLVVWRSEGHGCRVAQAWESARLVISCTICVMRALMSLAARATRCRLARTDQDNRPRGCGLAFPTAQSAARPAPGALSWRAFCTIGHARPRCGGCALASARCGGHAVANGGGACGTQPPTAFDDMSARICFKSSAACPARARRSNPLCPRRPIVTASSREAFSAGGTSSACALVRATLASAKATSHVASLKTHMLRT